MKVRALISFASADGGHAEGEVFELSGEQASAWLSAGLVERVVPEVETATQTSPELAVTRKGRR